jgi:hypothetical protein
MFIFAFTPTILTMRFIVQKTIYVTLFLFAILNKASSQNLYQHSGNEQSVTAKSVSGQGSNINVTYHRAYWRISPDSPSAAAPVKYLRGNVTTYFTTTQANVSSITFDFNQVHTIDSVKFRGAKLLAASIVWNSTTILQLNLPTTIVNIGSQDSIAIYYKGVPPAASGQALGYQKGGSSTNNYVYTLSESYEDRDWWPCKHDMTDKIDSMDIIISTPSTFWAAANGKLIDSTITGTNRTFTFKHRYPIASYLVSLAVAKYKRYDRTPVNVSGTNVPVTYNLFPGKTNTQYNNILTALDKSKLELTAFSTKYGDYPFKNEKHGFYEFGFGGGMEHQTFSGMGSSTLTVWDIIAHELAHQWFGDKVTHATWNDLWLTEGFARYNEIVAAELVTGTGNALTHRGAIKTTARATNTTPVYINNATTSNNIWTTNNNNAVYERGAMVVSQLRTLLGDTKFFQACTNYLNDPLLSYKAATTADLQRNMEPQFGATLNDYFNNWIYGSGTPSYTVNWNTTGNNITVQLNQTLSAGASVSHFAMPVVLRVANSANTSNTFLTIYERGDSIFVAGNGIGVGFAGKVISFNLTFAPATLTFDPNNVTMATGTTTKVTTPLRLASLSDITHITSSIKVYPNPATTEVIITTKDYIKDGVLHVLNVEGKTIHQQLMKGNMQTLHVQNIKAGNYFIQIVENGKVLFNEKLVIQH